MPVTLGSVTTCIPLKHASSASKIRSFLKSSMGGALFNAHMQLVVNKALETPMVISDRILFAEEVVQQQQQQQQQQHELRCRVFQSSLKDDDGKRIANMVTTMMKANVLCWNNELPSMYTTFVSSTLQGFNVSKVRKDKTDKDIDNTVTIANNIVTQLNQQQATTSTHFTVKDTVITPSPGYRYFVFSTMTDNASLHKNAAGVCQNALQQCRACPRVTGDACSSLVPGMSAMDMAKELMDEAPNGVVVEIEEVFGVDDTKWYLASIDAAPPSDIIYTGRSQGDVDGLEDYLKATASSVDVLTADILQDTVKFLRMVYSRFQDGNDDYVIMFLFGYGLDDDDDDDDKITLDVFLCKDTDYK